MLDIDGFTMSGSNATFAFWINPDVIANNIYVFDSNAPRTIIGFRGASSPFNLSYFDGGWKEFGAISLNTWQRVVITASGTTAKCYVNGVQLGVDKTITAIDLSSITSAAIGSGNTGGGSFFNGQLSDFQIWNSAWSATDVANDYASPNELVSSVSVSNLKAWWALTEGSGSTAYDSSGEGNNGTINGADYEPAQSSILQLGMINWSNGSGVFLPPSPTNSAQDILGNAVRDRLNSLNLTGTGYGEVADSASINPTSAITIQCWIKSNTENDKGLVAKWKSGATDYMLYKTSTSFRFYIGTDFLTSGIISNTVWLNIAGTYDGSSIKTFINGVQSSTSSLTGSIPNGVGPLEIGRYNQQSNKTYSERIDDVKIYDRALTADEILQNYKAGESAHTN